jgi:hypothetical protein
MFHERKRPISASESSLKWEFPKIFGYPQLSSHFLFWIFPHKPSSYWVPHWKPPVTEARVVPKKPDPVGVLNQSPASIRTLDRAWERNMCYGTTGCRCIHTYIYIILRIDIIYIYHNVYIYNIHIWHLLFGPFSVKTSLFLPISKLKEWNNIQVLLAEARPWEDPINIYGNIGGTRVNIFNMSWHEQTHLQTTHHQKKYVTFRGFSWGVGWQHGFQSYFTNYNRNFVNIGRDISPTNG